jgi:hypothetical protein
MLRRLADTIYDWAVTCQDVPTCESVIDLIRRELRQGRSFYEIECAFDEAASELRKLARRLRVRAPWDSEASREASKACAQADILGEVKFRTRF